MALRDVTIEWPGPSGLVNLYMDFGRRPDGGIVRATVEGKNLMKGVHVDMDIYKSSRTGTNYGKGKLVVRPLNSWL